MSWRLNESIFLSFGVPGLSYAFLQSDSNGGLNVREQCHLQSVALTIMQVCIRTIPFKSFCFFLTLQKKTQSTFPPSPGWGPMRWKPKKPMQDNKLLLIMHCVQYFFVLLFFIGYGGGSPIVGWRWHNDSAAANVWENPANPWERGHTPSLVKTQIKQ